MGELISGFYGFIAIFISLIYSLFVMLGGREENFLKIKNRIWGRYIAPFTLCTLILVLSLLSSKFSIWFLFCYLTYFISHKIGYGTEDLWKKIIKRMLWSLMRTASALPIVLVTGQWILFLLQATVGLLITLCLGVMNPLKAPQEEGLINFSSVMFVPFMVL